MEGLLGRIRALAAELGARAAEGPRPRAGVLRREGERWTISYEGMACRMKDSKGLRYLVHLLQHPGEPIHVRELVAAAAGSAFLPAAGSAGPILDAAAKRAYRQRLSELSEEEAEAERLNDLGRARRAREEIEVIAAELARSVGLGGRDREAASDTERARLAVRKGITAALRSIEDAHPGLGRELRDAVRTGNFCIYGPPPERVIVWRG
jgi:non-specific serine/threonine protein kinase